jgi:hypothetical protein
VLLLTALTCCAACARAPLPRGVGVPSPESTNIHSMIVQERCGVSTAAGPVLVGNLSVTGVAHGHRVHGRVWVGSRLGVLRLEPQSSPPGFVLFAMNFIKDARDPSDAPVTLFLPRQQRVVQVPSRTLVEALIGVPLSMQEFEGVLWGCPTWGSGGLDARKFGDTFVTVWVQGESGVDELIAHRNDAMSPWTLYVLSRKLPGQLLWWRAEYADLQDHVFRSIRLVSEDWNGELGRSFDLHLSLQDVHSGPVFDSDLLPPAFTAAMPLSFQEFQQQRPRRDRPLVTDPRPLE